MKEIAILGATASGKSALAIEIAKEVGANILSLDSLSIYKDVDIVSAKPTLKEREGVKHFGIDEIFLDEYFSAATFFDIYKRAKKESYEDGKHLIITGGSSFYLKSMIEGLSKKIDISDETHEKVISTLLDLESAYGHIKSLDFDYAKEIKSNDTYRISKWFEIYIESGMVASEYFLEHKKESIVKDIDIFDIAIDRKELKQRIDLRSKIMIDNGLIDEVFEIEKRYGRDLNPMRAIGIIETFSYLDGKIDIEELHTLISIHTAQLAKRQETFNRSQFPNIQRFIKKDLKNKLLSYF
jgi:tRNA dimethylallyltransferase